MEDRIEKINTLDWKIESGVATVEVLKNEYIKCNTIDIDLSDPIYKIMSFSGLARTLSQKIMSMSKPKTWPDPFEVFLLNSVSQMKDGRWVGYGPLREKIYCQCWSQRKECEGLWNTHSENYNYVKIKSTSEKIMKYLYDTSNDFHYLSYFCGRVSYVEEDEIEKLFQEGIGKFFTSSSYMSIISSLLIKRNPFDYEEEVRFIFDVPSRDDIDMSKIKNRWNVADDYFYFSIDINDLIDGIVLHPYLDATRANEIEKDIRGYGYTGNIIQSSLFKKRKFVSKF